MSWTPGILPEDAALIEAGVPAHVWEALLGQRIFLTGGTGFFGCWLLEALLAGEQRHGLGLSLTVLSRDPARFLQKAPHLAGHRCVQLVQGDMADLSALAGPFDIVLHAATDVVLAGSDPQSTFNAITGGTAQALALARRSGARRFLLTSSGAVYGRQPLDMLHVPESYAGAPDTTALNQAYGHAKRVSEFMTACHSQHMATRIARCFAFSGAYLPLDAHFAIGNFIGDALAGRTIRIGGDGTPLRSYLYAADLAIWLLTILVDGDQQPYNVGGDEAVSIGQLAGLVSRTLTGQERVEIARQPEPGKAPERYVPSTARAGTLGLRTFTSLEQQILRTAAWHTARKHTAESQP